MLPGFLRAYFAIVFYLMKTHPFSNFPLKIEASLGELNPKEIKSSFYNFIPAQSPWHPPEYPRYPQVPPGFFL